MMPPDESAVDASSLVEVRCCFVRKRNALAVRGQFGPMLVDYYLHAADHGLRLAGVLDTMMKEALVAMTLHLASKPWQESHSWTLNLQKPLANLFVTGDNATARVAGRGFTKDVKRHPRNLLYAQSLKPKLPLRQSMVEVQGHDFLRIIEQYYLQSEQRRARFFEHSDEDYVFVSAQPQCDLPWLENLTAGAIRSLEQDEDLSLLETRHYWWECGCTLEKLYAAVRPHAQRDIDAFFAGRDVLKASCPRCGARYHIAREQLEAWLAAHGHVEG